MLTAFIHGIGASSAFAFHDVYGLDEELLMMLPQPVQAMVLLFPSADAVRSGQTKEDAVPPSAPFFLWQGQALGNACGTIASIHAVANSAAGEQLTPGGPLATFLAKTAGMHPAERGLALETDEAIQSMHAAQASQGQTSSAGVCARARACVSVYAHTHERVHCATESVLRVVAARKPSRIHRISPCTQTHTPPPSLTHTLTYTQERATRWTTTSSVSSTKMAVCTNLMGSRLFDTHTHTHTH